MEYRKFADTIILRLDPGEEIVESLLLLAKKEQIHLAEISGLGAVNDITVGVFDVAEKKYLSNHFNGYFEIVSLTGTLSRQGEEPYLHVHLSAGDIHGSVIGGHLNRAVISATAEIVIRLIDGTVNRRFEEEVGLNLFEFV